MQPTAAQGNGPSALVAVLALVIITLAGGLTAMLLTGQGTGAMP